MKGILVVKMKPDGEDAHNFTAIADFENVLPKGKVDALMAAVAAMELTNFEKFLFQMMLSTWEPPEDMEVVEGAEACARAKEEFGGDEV